MILLLACAIPEEVPGPAPCDDGVRYADGDGDGAGAGPLEGCEAEGVGVPGDCDDADAGVFPGADETCDGVDEDCDGAIDEGAVDAPVWYEDADADGWGGDAIAACEAPAGFVQDAGDCDDLDPDTRPDGVETCDGLDEDCDGVADDDAIDPAVWFADADGDGFGDAGATTGGCTAPPGYVADATDCNDADGGTFPGAVEACDDADQDCDGEDDDDAADAPGWYADADGDAYGDATSVTYACDAPDSGWVEGATDCDDDDAGRHPLALEVCDGEDDDCDGDVDEAGSFDEADWYADADGDGYGDPGTSASACDAPVGYVADATDCDDGDAAVSPAGVEVCDGVDQDCDALADETGADAPVWYADADGDGYGDPASTTAACDSAPAGYVSNSSDCDDTDAAVSPMGVETCDGVDEDCDGATDEGGADAASWHADADGDGFGDAASTVAACDAPAGWVADGTDCDDTLADVYPRAPETDCADATDYNCDGASGREDTDGDGVVACLDCDDADPDVLPGAEDLCDGVDDDCDGEADEDGDRSAWYADADGDGYGDPADGALACTAPVGRTADSTDCDDADAAVSPGVSETCATADDDDCDGDTNDPDAAGCERWYFDDDGDGYGSTSNRCYCEAAEGYTVRDDSDCDDGDPLVFPGADEAWGDGVDDDCDGTPDLVELPDVGVELTGAESSYGDAGEAVAIAGDMDGDGYAELVVGNSNDDSHTGAAFIVRGPEVSSGPLADVDARWRGDSALDYAGVAVAGAGDVDGDGLADVLVGATEDDDGASGGGAVHLLTTLGSGDEDLGSATSKLVAAGAGDDFGYAVAGAGDVDGDGLDDVLVGARFQDGVGSQSGAAYLFVAPRSGTVSASAATATLLGEAASDLAGEGLAGGEDLDGDGLSDLVVGASGAGSYGRVYVFHGPVTGTVSLSAADARIDGSYLLEQLGEAIALLPDLAGDGYPDLLLGSEHAADEGAAYVFAGPLSASATTADAHATFLGDGTANFDVGSSVASAGDVDGDEVTDVLVGDRRATGVAVQHGAVYLFYGPHAGARPVEDAEMVFAGEGTGDYAGSAVAAGDVDADGVPDLVIGATGRYGGGAAYLVYGP